MLTNTWYAVIPELMADMVSLKDKLSGIRKTTSAGARGWLRMRPSTTIKTRSPGWKPRQAAPTRLTVPAHENYDSDSYDDDRDGCTVKSHRAINRRTRDPIGDGERPQNSVRHYADPTALESLVQAMTTAVLEHIPAYGLDPCE